MHHLRLLKILMKIMGMIFQIMKKITGNKTMDLITTSPWLPLLPIITDPNQGQLNTNCKENYMIYR